MNIEDLTQLMKVELPYNERLGQFLSNEEVKQVIEKTLNKPFQQYLQAIPKEDYIDFVDAVCEIEDEQYDELQNVLTTKFENEVCFYHAIEGQSPLLDKALYFDLLEFGDSLIFELCIGATYEELIRLTVEKLILFTISANQRYLTEYANEFSETEDINQPHLLPDVRVASYHEKVLFSFTEGFQKNNNLLLDNLLSDRKYLYGAIMFAQGAGVDTPKNIEVLEKPHFKEYSEYSFGRVMSFVEDFIAFLSGIIKEYQYSNELLELLE